MCLFCVGSVQIGVVVRLFVPLNVSRDFAVKRDNVSRLAHRDKPTAVQAVWISNPVKSIVAFVIRLARKGNFARLESAFNPVPKTRKVALGSV